VRESVIEEASGLGSDTENDEDDDDEDDEDGMSDFSDLDEDDENDNDDDVTSLEAIRKRRRRYKQLKRLKKRRLDEIAAKTVEKAEEKVVIEPSALLVAAPSVQEVTIENTIDPDSKIENSTQSKEADQSNLHNQSN